VEMHKKAYQVMKQNRKARNAGKRSHGDESNKGVSSTPTTKKRFTGVSAGSAEITTAENSYRAQQSHTGSGSDSDDIFVYSLDDNVGCEKKGDQRTRSTQLPKSTTTVGTSRPNRSGSPPLSNIFDIVSSYEALGRTSPPSSSNDTSGTKATKCPVNTEGTQSDTTSSLSTTIKMRRKGRKPRKTARVSQFSHPTDLPSGKHPMSYNTITYGG
jgi:hypothetical protein